MLKTLLVVSIMSTSLNAMATGSQSSNYAPPPSATPSFTISCTACEELLQECKRLMDDCDEAIEAQADTIDMLELQKKVQARELADARAELNSRRAWYKAPAFVFTAGVLAGFLLSTQVGK